MTRRAKEHPRGRPVPIAEALPAWLDAAGLAARIGQAALLGEWPALVGERIAAVTAPEAVSADGVLRVRVATAAWANELQLMTPTIIARLNAGRGAGRITGIRWIAGIDRGRR